MAQSVTSQGQVLFGINGKALKPGSTRVHLNQGMVMKMLFIIIHLQKYLNQSHGGIFYDKRACDCCKCWLKSELGKKLWFYMYKLAFMLKLQVNVSLQSFL